MQELQRLVDKRKEREEEVEEEGGRKDEGGWEEEEDRARLAIDQVLSQLSTFSLPLSSVAGDEMASLFTLLCRAWIGPAGGGKEGGREDRQGERRRRRRRVVLRLGLRVSRFFLAVAVASASATIKKDMSTPSLASLQLVPIVEFWAWLLRHYTQGDQDEDEDEEAGAEEGMEEALQALAQLLHDHGNKMDALYASLLPSLLSLADPSSSLSRRRRVRATAAETAQGGREGELARFLLHQRQERERVAALECVGLLCKHQLPSLRPQASSILLPLFLASLSLSLSAPSTSTAASLPSSLPTSLRALLHLLLDGPDGMGRGLDGGNVGVLVRVINRVLQPSGVRPQEGATRGPPTPVWRGLDDSADDFTGGTEGGHTSHPPSSFASPPPRATAAASPSLHPSPSSASTRSLSRRRISHDPNASLPFSLPPSLRLLSLQLLSLLASSYPKALLPHWPLLLPDTPSLPPFRPSFPPAFPPPLLPSLGPPPLLLFLEWCDRRREGKAAAAGMAALAHMLKSAPLKQWSEALARQKPTRSSSSSRNNSNSNSSTSTTSSTTTTTTSNSNSSIHPPSRPPSLPPSRPPARLSLTDKWQATLAHIHAALPILVLGRREGGRVGGVVASSGFYQELLKVISTLLSSFPPSLPSSPSSLPFSLPCWEVAKRDMRKGVREALFLLHRLLSEDEDERGKEEGREGGREGGRGGEEGGREGRKRMDARTRHEIMHAIAAMFQAAASSLPPSLHPSLLSAHDDPIRALLLHRADGKRGGREGGAAFIDQLLEAAAAPAPAPAATTTVITTTTAAAAATTTTGAMAASPPRFERQDALLLLGRAARGYGSLLLFPSSRLALLMKGVLQANFAAPDQNLRLHALKVVEELLQWRKEVKARHEGQAASEGREEGGLSMVWVAFLMRHVRRAFLDPYHGVRAVACACLSHFEAQDWREGGKEEGEQDVGGKEQEGEEVVGGEEEGEEKREEEEEEGEEEEAISTEGCLARMIVAAREDTISGIKANACRVLGVLLPHWTATLALPPSLPPSLASSALLVASRDARLGVRAQAIWAISNFSHSLSMEGGREGGRVDVAAICAAALEVLRAQPEQEKTTSSALRAIGHLLGQLNEEEQQQRGGVALAAAVAAAEGGSEIASLRRACLSAILDIVQGQGREGEEEGAGEKGKDTPVRVKARWNACCALTSFLHATAWRRTTKTERKEGLGVGEVDDEDEGREEGEEGGGELGPIIAVLLHASLTDRNVKVRAHAAAGLRAVGPFPSSYDSYSGGGFPAVLDAALEAYMQSSVVSSHPPSLSASRTLDRLLQHLVGVALVREREREEGIDGETARRVMTWLRQAFSKSGGREVGREGGRKGGYQELAQRLWEEGMVRVWDVDVLEGLRALARSTRVPIDRGRAMEKESTGEELEVQGGEEEEEL
ncbi:armadillo-like helical domain-containing protein [Nannochloropsis oceanica]